MSPTIIISVLVIYFLLLILISRLTSRKSNNNSFFLGERKSPWYVVAYGMIGASLSGVTFISIPGWVGKSSNQFSYMQAVFGFFVGYLIVAKVLLPLYYRMELTSIYEYLKERYGNLSYKAGAFFFLLSRIIGASVRLLLVANVLQSVLFDKWNIPFELTVIVSVLLIWLYTNRGGIKTIVWTDTLQTTFMLASVVVTFILIGNALSTATDLSVIESIRESDYSQIFFFDDFNSSNHFIKHFFGGIFITIGMTGLDQDMMQKNLTCKNTKESQRNMLSMAGMLVLVNLVFLSLGALLYLYVDHSSQINIEDISSTDLLFSTVAMNPEIGVSVGILFLLGLIAAAYSSADSALTSLTTSFSIDFLNVKSRNLSVEAQEKKRKIVHVIMSIAVVFTVLILKKITELADEDSDISAISLLMKCAGFTYGPLIGMFFFGIFSKRIVKDYLVLIASGIAIFITFGLWWFSKGGPGIENGEPGLLGDYVFGFELILINAIIAFLTLFLFSKRNYKNK